ncbi:hypothetical protein D0962_04295 [Leptolyngbyaceae cyanobacterium CCMR0082]|uniref:Uncharacterized protein n=1 Tax=Adonisia turfae CCMR0082 TaxID=2304604 RepID=A0A6M0S206_9CYAN|nr:hypothetical protein [Adonisia turfae CCMR0082]
MTSWKGCNFCVHKTKGKSTCKAFPEGIPFPIASGSLPHTSKMFNQSGDEVYKEIETEEPQ